MALMGPRGVFAVKRSLAEPVNERVYGERRL